MSNAELVKKFTPVLWLHSDEKYFPCSIEWMLANSTLKDFNTNTVISPVTHRDLFNIAQKYDFKRRADGDVVLHYPPDTFRGESPLSRVPCYALVREQGDFLYVTYLFIFIYNGEYNILGLAEAGGHPGDIEHITVEVRKSDGGLSRVFFSAHGTKDGRWVPASQLEYLNGKIVCYVALNGHGLYPHEGTVLRLAGVGNDQLDKGFLWEPRALEFFSRSNPSFNPDTMGFFVYNSRLGGSLKAPNTEGITGLPDKSWIQRINNVDPKFYNPPAIYSPKKSHVAYGGKRIARFALAYVLVFMLLNVVTRMYKGKFTSPFGVKENAMTIVAAIVLYALYENIGYKLINKFAPS
jgi:hypothetical protein